MTSSASFGTASRSTQRSSPTQSQSVGTRHPKTISRADAELQLRIDAEIELRRRERRPRYYDRPDLFAEEMLGIRPWSRQRELLLAVAEQPRVACRSGHKVAKTNSLGILALWFVFTRVRAPRVIMTSATDRQVNRILWREVVALHRRAAFILGGEASVKADPGLRWADGREIIGFSTSNAENFAGFSGADLLFLIDEASGVADVIFETIEGNSAGDAKTLMVSNPTKTSGTFFNAFHAGRAEYHTIHISSEESPNITGTEPEVPGLAAPTWLDERKRFWGKDSPRYQVRVKGNFPRHAENAIVGLEQLEAALGRWATTLGVGTLHLGVDPARFGDDESVVVVRRGYKVLVLRDFMGLDGPQLAGKVLAVLREFALEGEQVHIKVDEIGVGASCFDQLALEAAKPTSRFHLTGVNTARASTEPDKYVNLRTQLHFAGAEWLEAGGALPKDPKLEAEAVAPTYSFVAGGQYKVESKDDMKKRLKRSPDRWDATLLAIYSPPPVEIVRVRPAPPQEPRWSAGQRGF
jgi:phage terminase large subunit